LFIVSVSNSLEGICNGLCLHLIIKQVLSNETMIVADYFEIIYILIQATEYCVCVKLY